MIKKGLVTGALFALGLGCAYANGSEPPMAPPVPCGDFYMGVGLSGDFNYFKVNQEVHWNTVCESCIQGSHSFASNWNQSVAGVDAELFVGYRWNFSSRHFLGVEAMGALSTAQGFHKIEIQTFGPEFTSPENFIINEKEIFDSSYRIENRLGIRGVLGTMVNPLTYAFITVGVVNGQVKVDDVGDGTNDLKFLFPEAQTTVPFGTSRRSTNKSGLALGVGAEAFLLSPLSVRVHFEWARFGSISHRNSTGVFTDPLFVPPITPVSGSGAGVANDVSTADATTPAPVLGGVTELGQSKIRPTVSTIMVGLVYHF